VPSQTGSSVLYDDALDFNLLSSNRPSKHLGGTTMPIFRSSVFHALAVIGGLFATPLFAQSTVVETNANAPAAASFGGLTNGWGADAVSAFASCGHAANQGCAAVGQ
jgi:hypothetical protein